MRIAIAGKGFLAVRAARLLRALIDMQSVEAILEVVRNRDDTGQDTWLPSLVRLATALEWPVHAAAEEANLGGDDLLLSLQHDRIVDCAALGGARAYNLHFAEVPRYRGSLTSVWPVRRGEKTAAVTLHVLTGTVDGGPVLTQRRFEIPPFYTAYDLYLACHRYGFELFTEQLPVLLTGAHDAVPQDESLATTFTRSSIDFSESVLDFSGTSEAVRDRYRSLVFPPTQYPVFRGRAVRSCYALPWCTPTGQPPGSVLSEQVDHVVVVCGSGVICLEFQAPGPPFDVRLMACECGRDATMDGTR